MSVILWRSWAPRCGSGEGGNRSSSWSCKSMGVERSTYAVVGKEEVEIQPCGQF
jgi:hypothetical protein